MSKLEKGLIFDEVINVFGLLSNFHINATIKRGFNTYQMRKFGQSDKVVGFVVSYENERNHSGDTFAAAAGGH